jgi:hypothetical protein
MVKHCINPVCRAEFKLYNSGFLYAHERPSHDTEFFWMCSPCATRFIPALDETGKVAVRPRVGGMEFLPPRRDGDLRIVSSAPPPQRMPWRQNAPASDRIPPVPTVLYDRSAPRRAMA